MSEAVSQTLNSTYEETVRIPSGVMQLVRQSYDTRDKVLDWMLAIFVAGALIYVFRAPLMAMVKPDLSINAGKVDVVPDNAICEAVGNGQPVGKIYTYNMPQSRQNIASRIGPSSVRMPYNPGYGPQFNAVTEETFDAD
jgi:hypothetical protein